MNPPTPTPADTAMVELTRALKLLVNEDNYMDPTFDPVATAQSAITHLAHLSERVTRAEETLNETTNVLRRIVRQDSMPFGVVTRKTIKDARQAMLRANSLLAARTPKEEAP
jgi:hypothetical protein